MKSSFLDLSWFLNNKELILKFILVNSFNIFWFIFMYGHMLNNLPMHTIYAIYLIKCLIIAMINIAIIHKKLSVKGFIFCCIIPFVIAFILLFKADFIYLITFFTNMLLIEIKTDNIWIHNIFNKLKHYIHILKTVKFNELKNFFSSLVYEQLNLHTLGGSPEECKKAFFKPANVNYTKSSGEPSGGRATSPAGSETSDLYGSDESARGNSPQGSGSGVGANSSSIGSGATTSNQARPVTISPYNYQASSVGSSSNNPQASSVGSSSNNPQVNNPINQGRSVTNNPSTNNRPSVPSNQGAPVHYNRLTSFRPIASKGIPIASSPFTNTSVNSQNTTRLPSIAEILGVPTTGNTQVWNLGGPEPYVRDTRRLDHVHETRVHVGLAHAINTAYERLDVQYGHIPDDQKLKHLKPIIAALLEKREGLTFLTISDIAELKYILSLSNNRTGLNNATRGLYNRDLIQYGNSVSVQLNWQTRYKKKKIFDDLKAIQTRLNAEGQ